MIDLILCNRALWGKRIPIMVLKQLTWNPFSLKMAKNVEGSLNFQRISIRVVVAVMLSMKRVKRWMCFCVFSPAKTKNKGVC